MNGGTIGNQLNLLISSEIWVYGIFDDFFVRISLRKIRISL